MPANKAGLELFDPAVVIGGLNPITGARLRIAAAGLEDYSADAARDVARRGCVLVRTPTGRGGGRAILGS
jgi:F0F1-type ATP synthase beta subunit